MTVEKLKAFLTILLVSGYAKLSRQEMYWERREDCHNLVVSAMMIKIEFLECKQCLHLADNNALNSSDEFAKGDHYLMLLTNNAFSIFNLPTM